MSNSADNSNNVEKNIDLINKNLVETTVRFIGNKQTICQVVKLLAYIRHAVKNSKQTNISVNVGKHIVNTDFTFDVNDTEIPDLITQNTIDIN